MKDIGMTRGRWLEALTWEGYLDSVTVNEGLWKAVYERARAPEDVVEGLRAAIEKPRYLLALSEDWCGDAVNALPVVARMAEAVEGLELRVLERDETPDLMDLHLTGRSRSIPVVMALDEDFQEIGWWGPRPGHLQSWVLSAEGKSMASPDRYKKLRGWYARDRGKTIAHEVAQVICGGACVEG
jgi:hypothetical protein